MSVGFEQLQHAWLNSVFFISVLLKSKLLRLLYLKNLLFDCGKYGTQHAIILIIMEY